MFAVEELGQEIAKSRFRAPDGRPRPAVPAREASEDALASSHGWVGAHDLDLSSDTRAQRGLGCAMGYQPGGRKVELGGRVTKVASMLVTAATESPSGLAWWIVERHLCSGAPIPGARILAASCPRRAGSIWSPSPPNSAAARAPRTSCG